MSPTHTYHAVTATGRQYYYNALITKILAVSKPDYAAVINMLKAAEITALSRRLIADMPLRNSFRAAAYLAASPARSNDFAPSSSSPASVILDVPFSPADADTYMHV